MKRKLPAHGNHRNAVLRSYREGYRLKAIARMHRTTQTEAARIITASGVCWSHIGVGER